MTGTLLERAHAAFVYTRRIERLSEALAALIPRGARVLDVGSGDGALAAAILARRADLELEGVDVLVRPGASIPITEFDGERLPYGDAAFDAVLLADVLHHAERPGVLLAEAKRVASTRIVLKDHLLQGALAQRTLELMDRTGNRRYGVTLRYEYWPRARWERTFRELGLRVAEWNEDLGLYPWPARLVFDRSLHFVAALEPRAATAVSSPPR